MGNPTEARSALLMALGVFGALAVYPLANKVGLAYTIAALLVYELAVTSLLRSRSFERAALLACVALGVGVLIALFFEA